jgi:hypothetical protein
MLKRADVANVRGGLPAAADPAWAKGIPLVLEYLTQTAWEDGKPREVATITIVAEGGSWRVCLNDRAMSRSCWISGETVHKALEALEKALQEDKAGWRATKPWGRPTRS